MFHKVNPKNKPQPIETMKTFDEVEKAMHDKLFREAYGKDWLKVRNWTHFQNAYYGQEIPLEIHGWEWSTTFGRWSALVTFENGWRGFTYPHPPPVLSEA